MVSDKSRAKIVEHAYVLPSRALIRKFTISLVGVRWRRLKAGLTPRAPALGLRLRVASQADRGAPHLPAKEARWPPGTHQSHPRIDRAHGNGQLDLGLPAHPWSVEEGRASRGKDNDRDNAEGDVGNSSCGSDHPDPNQPRSHPRNPRSPDPFHSDSTGHSARNPNHKPSAPHSAPAAARVKTRPEPATLDFQRCPRHTEFVARNN
ncbi:MAG: hypothetical protein ACJAUC_003857 [Planctomycetota bacterium]|jgi:hypothetical protein